MNTDTTLSAFSDAVRGAILSGYADVAEDGTLCFVSDKVYRACPDCGTVFAGSAARAALAGPGRCPYCGRRKTAPLAARRPS